MGVAGTFVLFYFFFFRFDSSKDLYIYYILYII